MDYQRTFPFYAAYPQYPNWNQISEDRIMEDLEYLQQMYPAYAKRYQVKISEVLDRIDYEGSMIYDEYPDRWQLERLVRSVMQMIKAEEGTTMHGENQNQAEDTSQEAMRDTWLRELLTVLLYYEVLKRRRKRKNYHYF